MKQSEITKNILLGKTCENCTYYIEFNKSCIKKHDISIHTCEEFTELDLFTEAVFSTVRQAYPSTIANKLVSVQPMEKSDGNIFNLTFQYGHDKDDKDESK